MLSNRCFAATVLVFVMLVPIAVMMRSGGLSVFMVMIAMVITPVRAILLMAMFFVVMGMLVRVVMVVLVLIAHCGWRIAPHYSKRTYVHSVLCSKRHWTMPPTAWTWRSHQSP